MLDNYLHIDGNNLGKSFRDAREAQHMTRDVLAKKALLHYNTIGMLERGEARGSVFVYLSVAKALGYDGVVFDVNNDDKGE